MSGTSIIGQILRTGGDRCLLKCAIAEKRIRQHIFFRHFLTPKM